MTAGPVSTEPIRKLRDTIIANPAAPLRLAIVAPGGYGKSTLLRELSRAYRDAGVDVVTDWPTTGADDWRKTAMLVDDAHLLPGPQLRLLREVGCARLVVTARPWPRPPELAELIHTLGRGHPPMTLPPWDPRTVRRVADPGGAEIHDLTGGVPRWVTSLARAWPWNDVPVDVLRPDLEALDPDVVRYLMAVHSGMGLRLDLLSGLLGRDTDGVTDVMRAARATGLLTQDGALLPLCALAIPEVVPAEQYLGVLQRLAELQLDHAEPILPFARFLLGSGATGATVAAVLDQAAREVAGHDPETAAELFGAAVSAGRPLTAVVADWARAAALAGDLDTALRLADQAISGQEPACRAAAARVAAAALAHRGQWARSAELYGWAGDGPFGAIAALATGNPPVPATRADGPPTLLDGAAVLMAEGVRASVSGSPVEALSLLVRASALLEPAGRDALVPDSPAALAALVALHCGELDVAESVMDSAGGMGGAVLRNRHALLRAWTCMARGRLADAWQLSANLTDAHPRDRLFHVALDIGLARRSGDTMTLRRMWTHVGDCLVRHPVDLFTLLPLSEFAVAAARLRDPARLGTALSDAMALLHRLGDPPLWAAPLHWAGLHAALVIENPEAAGEHLRVLAMNPTSYGAALTQAGKCWLDVVAGRVDPDQVQAAAHALLDAGHWWDSARLASEAAIRTTDRKDMVTLLDCARQLQSRQQSTRPPQQSPLETDSPLSDREREVADLVVQGMTYKQIGDKLFISAKTVEHHMARIRHRLGVANRSELITQLRALRPGTA
ncbi:LuxR C-terminal-related transcriptional regulator [Actinocrispum sp. NPDC049592]|uniref:helix-turn-helix transcriptional regulator n=1 Tax=Actinocrispum sp. NPDC049592 TaxID=3154835 RepID=UPI00342F0B00